MAIAEDIIGTHYRYPDYFKVDREKVREFAAAVKDDHPAHFSEDAAKEVGYDSVVASLTFLAVAGRKVQLEIFNQFAIPINMERVLHRDQKITFHRPIVAGDKLFFDSYLDNVIEAHGTVVAEIRGEASDANGDGQVSMSEYSRSWSSSAVSEFRRYDLNDDGIITATEAAKKK